MRSFIFLRISMSSSNKLPLKKLTENFYLENSGLLEVLDKDLGQGWKSSSKVRGYGIILISINSLTFGIPLRSNIKHKQAFFTTPKTDNDQYGRKGLDYSKAVLITDNNHVDNSSFRIHVKEVSLKSVLLMSRKSLHHPSETHTSLYVKYLLLRYYEALQHDLKDPLLHARHTHKLEKNFGHHTFL